MKCTLRRYQAVKLCKADNHNQHWHVGQGQNQADQGISNAHLPALHAPAG